MFYEVVGVRNEEVWKSGGPSRANFVRPFLWVVSGLVINKLTWSRLSTPASIPPSYLYAYQAKPYSAKLSYTEQADVLFSITVESCLHWNKPTILNHSFLDSGRISLSLFKLSRTFVLKFQQVSCVWYFAKQRKRLLSLAWSAVLVSPTLVRLG